MIIPRGRFVRFIAIAIGCGLAASSAWAGYIATVEQVGSDLVATGSGTGNIVGMQGNAGDLSLPADHVSGPLLSDSSIYNNTTFGSLGINPGVYESTRAPAANQNFTPDDVVPVPDSGATGVLLLLGLTAAFGLRFLRVHRTA